MKTKIFILVAVLVSALTTSGRTDFNKEIIGEWCNPYTYESTGEIKGFNFKKGGKCEGINVPVLDLKKWEIINGKLIITGFRVDENGVKSDYRTEERIVQLSNDSLLVVAQEEEPRLEYLYVRIHVAKKAYPNATKK